MTYFEKEGEKTDTRAREGEISDEVSEEKKKSILGVKEKPVEDQKSQRVISYEELKKEEQGKTPFKKEGNVAEQKEV